MTASRVFAVDRIERDGARATAVLIAEDDGSVLRVAASHLGPDAVEGAVLRVRLGPSGPSWATAIRDVAAERRLRLEAEERLRRLRADDPGGDLAL